MAVPALSGHALVGGTALALRYGHRLSVVLDRSASEQDHDALQAALVTDFGSTLQYEPEGDVPLVSSATSTGSRSIS